MTDTKDVPPKQDLIGFAPLVEQALRGVVREALRKVARDGLPGDHHFYITCRTGEGAVELPPYLRAKFPGIDPLQFNRINGKALKISELTAKVLEILG